MKTRRIKNKIKRKSRKLFVEKTAGFIVLNETYDKVLLLLSPTGYYDFPKGHTEPSDRGNLLTTAKREMLEETGIRVQEKQLFHFHHIANFKFFRKHSHIKGRPSGNIRKEIHLYLCAIPESTHLKLQKNEISGYAWLPLKTIESHVYKNLIHKGSDPHDVLWRRALAMTNAIVAARRFIS